MSDRADLALAMSTVALVPSIYSAALPNLADTRAQADDRGHLAAAQQYATVVAGAVVLGVAGVTRSPLVALAGLVAVIGFASAYENARRAHP